MADIIQSQPKKVIKPNPNPCGTCAGVGIVMIILVGIYIIYAFNVSNQNTQTILNSRPTPVTAGQLIAAYAGNTISGDDRYKGKLIEITGLVQNVDTTLGQPYVALTDNGSDASNILCSFNSGADSQLASLVSGQTVTLEGIGDGASALGGSVMVNNCSLITQ